MGAQVFLAAVILNGGRLTTRCMREAGTVPCRPAGAVKSTLTLPGHGIWPHDAEEAAVSDPMLLLALATENAELRAQLAEMQDQCVELAVDAGELHAEVEVLRRELAEIRAERHP